MPTVNLGAEERGMEQIQLLGKKAKDLVTGFKGVITCVSFDLYGCVQAVLTNESNKEGKWESAWFDVKRLRITDEKRVMEVPNFRPAEVPGPEPKPSFETKPAK